jgi:hypothetical protein
MADIPKLTVTFSSLINVYAAAQKRLAAQMSSLAKGGCGSVDPSKFILMQFTMSNVTQVGESISNMISQVNSVVNHAVQNQISR